MGKSSANRDERSLDLANIQGNIVRPYGYRYGGYLFLTIGNAAAGRRWLGEIEITTASPWAGGCRPDHALNLAATAQGLAALEVPDCLLATFPEVFRDGMKSRAADLGDIGPSRPDSWEKGLSGEAHLVLTVHARTAELAGEKMDQLRARVDDLAGVEIVHELPCVALEGSREHFGFGDGFGQPAVEGSGHTHLDGQGIPDGADGWRPLRAGEFVLGYEDEDGVLPDAPGEPFGDNGSYMVLRKLEQDVACFRQYVAKSADDLGLSRQLVAAKLVGRWEDGTPLELSPDTPDRGISGQKAVINNFRYRDDPQGFRCPLGAHIRRANPRDALGFGGQLTKRHRMIRRGRPYGLPLPEGTEDDGKKRGLVFVCFVASIERQFEFVQREWCNDGNAFGLGYDRDFLAGRPATGDEVTNNETNKMTVQGRSPRFLDQRDATFVVTRGGDYFYAPGIRGLRALAKGDW